MARSGFACPKADLALLMANARPDLLGVHDVNFLDDLKPAESTFGLKMLIKFPKPDLTFLNRFLRIWQALVSLAPNQTSPY